MLYGTAAAAQRLEMGTNGFLKHWWNTKGFLALFVLGRGQQSICWTLRGMLLSAGQNCQVRVTVSSNFCFYKQVLIPHWTQWLQKRCKHMEKDVSKWFMEAEDINLPGLGRPQARKRRFKPNTGLWDAILAALSHLLVLFFVFWFFFLSVQLPINSVVHCYFCCLCNYSGCK